MKGELTLVPLKAGLLHVYLREINKIKQLSPEEEFELARRWYDEGDIEAVKRLAIANLKFVVKIAYEYVKYGFPLIDLIQEGNIGLLKAIKKFNPYKGFRLISYAIWWIRAHIHDFIIRSWSMVKIATTKLQRKLFTMLQSTHSALKKVLFSDLDDPEIRLKALAEDMDTTVDAIMDMNRRIKNKDFSLESTVYTNQGDDKPIALKDKIELAAPNPEETAIQKDLYEKFQKGLQRALPKLTDRERFILNNRILSDTPIKLEELGNLYGISKERARQIEEHIIQKLKREMTGILLPSLSNA